MPQSKKNNILKYTNLHFVLLFCRSATKNTEVIVLGKLPSVSLVCPHLAERRSLRLVRTSFELRAMRTSWLFTDISSRRNSSRYSLISSVHLVDINIVQKYTHWRRGGRVCCSVFGC